MTQTQNLIQRSDAWFAARKSRITGSMAGACLGMAPYMTHEQAMRTLVRSHHGAPSEFQDNPATGYGTRNEPDAIWAYELETGNTVTEVGFYTKDDWLGASPDGQVSPTKGLECKCPFGLRGDPEPQFKTLEEQPHYKLQVHLEMYCAGWTEMDFWQWSAHGSKLETVKLDLEYLLPLVDELRLIYDRFMETEIHNHEHLEPLRKEVNTNLAISLAGEYDDLQEAIDNATERLKEVKAELISLCDGKSAIIGGKRVTLVEKKGSVSYAKAIKDLMPDADLSKYMGKASKQWRVT